MKHREGKVDGVANLHDELYRSRRLTGGTGRPNLGLLAGLPLWP
jgi:hypothetical protein